MYEYVEIHWRKEKNITPIVTWLPKDRGELRWGVCYYIAYTMQSLLSKLPPLSDKETEAQKYCLICPSDRVRNEPRKFNSKACPMLPLSPSEDKFLEEHRVIMHPSARCKGKWQQYFKWKTATANQHSKALVFHHLRINTRPTASHKMPHPQKIKWEPNDRPSRTREATAQKGEQSTCLLLPKDQRRATHSTSLRLGKWANPIVLLLHIIPSPRTSLINTYHQPWTHAVSVSWGTLGHSFSSAF